MVDLKKNYTQDKKRLIKLSKKLDDRRTHVKYGKDNKIEKQIPTNDCKE